MHVKVQLKLFTAASGKWAVAQGMGVLVMLEHTAHRGHACGGTVVVLLLSLSSLILQLS